MNTGPVVTILASYITEIIFRVPRLMKLGETIEGGVETGYGGKGFNMAIGCKRAGAGVNVIMKVGGDFYGENAIRLLEAEGIDTRYVHRDKNRPSGAGVVLLLPNGQNAIVIDSGANTGLTVEEVESYADVIRNSDVVMAPLEMPVDAVTRAFEIAREAGKKTVLNPAPAPQGRLPGNLLKVTSVVTPNETEAETITGVVLESHNCTRAAGERLLETGPNAVVITLGEHGMYYTDGYEYGFIHAPDVPVVDTTGAGDAFNAGLAVALARGNTLHDAVEFGGRVAALKVMKKGTSQAMPTLSEIERMTF